MQLLRGMTSFFESLSLEGCEITDSPRIKRLHSDRAKEFGTTALYFQELLSNHRSIYHTLTTGYDPQAKGTAERSVGLIAKSPLIIPSEEAKITDVILMEEASPPINSARTWRKKKVRSRPLPIYQYRLMWFLHLQERSGKSGWLQDRKRSTT